jgi:hypothetical protein
MARQCNRPPADHSKSPTPTMTMDAAAIHSHHTDDDIDRPIILH